MAGPQASNSSVQFSIRGVMLATVLAGLLCVAVAPLLQAFSAEKRWRFLAFLLAATAATAVIVALLCLRRRYVERVCGDVLLRVTRRSSRMLYLYYILLGALMAAAQIFWAYSFVEIHTDPASRILISVAGAATPVLLIPHTIVFLWWGPNVWSLELRQRGLVYYGFYFRRWREFLGYAWLDDPPSRLQIEVRGSSIGARVRAEQQAELVRILDHVQSSGGQLDEQRE